MTANNNTERCSGQTIEVSLPVGSRVILFSDVEVEERDGIIGGEVSSHMFEDYIEQYSQETGLLRFEESDIGRAEFLEMLDEAAAVKIVQEEEVRKV